MKIVYIYMYVCILLFPLTFHKIQKCKYMTTHSHYQWLIQGELSHHICYIRHVLNYESATDKVIFY